MYMNNLKSQTSNYIQIIRPFSFQQNTSYNNSKSSLFNLSPAIKLFQSKYNRNVFKTEIIIVSNSTKAKI